MNHPMRLWHGGVKRFDRPLINFFHNINSSESKLRQYVGRAPSAIGKEPSWRRLAEAIKCENVETRFKDEVRVRISNPADHVAKIEEEIQEEMAKALGSTGAKCRYYFSLLANIDEECRCAEANGESLDIRIGKVRKFNEVRLLAEAARSELIIHRQAIGFTWRNQKIVEEEFPLPLKKPIPQS